MPHKTVNTLSHLRSSDFWPLIQGGPEMHYGYLATLKQVLNFLESISGNSLAEHEDLVSAEDELDIGSFLEDVAAQLGLPAPEIVIPISKVRADANTLQKLNDDSGYCVMWSLQSAAASKRMMDSKTLNFVAPARFTVRYRYFIPDGVVLILWSCMLLGLLGLNCLK